MKHLALSGLALGLLAAWPTVRADEKSVKPERGEYRVERDVVYGKGGDEEMKLDLAMPKEGKGPYPTVVCVHGGGWRGGKRQDLANPVKELDKRSMIEELASRGYVAATVSYRLSTVAPFPAQIEDCKAAVRFLRANADRYRVNKDRVGAVGFSAGGHLVCMMGAADERDGLEGQGGNADQSSRVQAVVSYFGPTDLTTGNWTQAVEDALLVPFIGAKLKDKPEAYKRASPITYVTKDDPPVLFIHGTKDTLVDVSQSHKMAAKLTEVGVKARVIEMEGDGHGWGGEKLLKTTEATIKFFDEHLKK